MKGRKGLGFSLVEALIGIAILAVVLGAFTFFLRSSRKEVEFSAEHFTAMLLAQKVKEDIAQELAINPWGLSTLGIDQESGQASHIVDGGSVFFSFLEDRYPPWRFIDPLDDGKIDQDMMPLYDQTKDFRIKVVSEMIPQAGDGGEGSPPGNLVRVGIEVTWKAQTGAGTYLLDAFFPLPDPSKSVASPFVVDRGKVERELCRAFYGKKGVSFQRVLSTCGGDEKTILAWGKIHYVCRSFFSSKFMQVVLKQIKKLEARRRIFAANGSDGLYACTLQLAQRYYEITKFSFNVISFLKEDLDTVRANFDEAHLGSFLWKRRRVLAVDGRDFMLVAKDFGSSLVWSRTRYQELLSPALAKIRGRRRQYRVLQRVYDLYKLATCVSGLPGARSDAMAFLEKVKAFSDGRNPFLNRFVLQEIALMQNFPEMMRRYPLLATVNDLFSVRVPNAADFFRRAFPPVKKNKKPVK